MSRVFAGAARSVRGDVEGGLAEMLAALEEHRAVVGSHITDIMLALIAAAYGQAQQWDTGLQQVDTGIALTEDTLEHVYAAELWRVKASCCSGRHGPQPRERPRSIPWWMSPSNDFAAL
jgi:hypothetical protein